MARHDVTTMRLFLNGPKIPSGSGNAHVGAYKIMIPPAIESQTAKLKLISIIVFIVETCNSDKEYQILAKDRKTVVVCWSKSLWAGR